MLWGTEQAPEGVDVEDVVGEVEMRVNDYGPIKEYDFGVPCT